MKRRLTTKKITIIFLSFILVVLVICIAIYYSETFVNPYEAQQVALARTLGVEINDYPYPGAFPEGYFYSKLRPGMEIKQVHNVVKGFDKVFRCRVPAESYYYKEVYFYFGDDNTDALRFMIFYDPRGDFERLQSEDTDSRSIRIDGCEEGRIETEP